MSGLQRNFKRCNAKQCTNYFTRIPHMLIESLTCVITGWQKSYWRGDQGTNSYNAGVCGQWCFHLCVSCMKFSTSRDTAAATSSSSGAVTDKTRHIHKQKNIKRYTYRWLFILPHSFICHLGFAMFLMLPPQKKKSSAHYHHSCHHNTCACDGAQLLYQDDVMQKQFKQIS